MHPDVPNGAALLLAAISKIETGKDGREAYDVVYGHNKTKTPITSWTLDEVEADGPNRTRKFGSSAAGAYQFMRDTLDKPGTLKDIEGEMGLSGKEKFSPDLQDLMGYHLLKRRGYLEFVNRKLTKLSFGKALAQEWASFPVLADTQGQKRKVKRGQSYYAGDGINKALVSPEKIEALLADVLALHNSLPPKDEPAPSAVQGNWLTALISIVVNIFKAIFGRKSP